MDNPEVSNIQLTAPQYTDPTAEESKRKWKYSTTFRALNYGQIISMSAFVFIAGVTLVAVDRFNKQPNSFTPSFAAQTPKPTAIPTLTPRALATPQVTKKPTPKVTVRTATPAASPIQ